MMVVSGHAQQHKKKRKQEQRRRQRAAVALIKGKESSSNHVGHEIGVCTSRSQWRMPCASRLAGDRILFQFGGVELKSRNREPINRMQYAHSVDLGGGMEYG
jgi:hypothetical protein